MYTPLDEPIAQLYERLKQTGYVTPIPTLLVDVRAQNGASLTRFVPIILDERSHYRSLKILEG